MIRWIGTPLLVIALLISMAGMPEEAPEGLPPCSTEDGGPLPCGWVAPDRGNGEGDSYIVEHDGKVNYLPHDRVRQALND